MTGAAFLLLALALVAAVGDWIAVHHQTKGLEYVCKPLTMVGLNLTHQAQATPAVVDRLRAVGNPAAEATVGWLSFFADTYRTVYGFAGPPVHDACALALLIDPSLVRSVDAFVAIETEGLWTRGATVVDLHGRLGRPANARVAMELDVLLPGHGPEILRAPSSRQTAKLPRHERR